MVSLFRLIGDSCHSGQISFDGVDIDKLGLSTLRPQLAIIPQDPVMFSGTVRSNLDPLGELSKDADGGNARLWDVLEKVRRGGTRGAAAFDQAPRLPSAPR